MRSLTPLLLLVIVGCQTESEKFVSRMMDDAQARFDIIKELGGDKYQLTGEPKLYARGESVGGPDFDTSNGHRTTFTISPTEDRRPHDFTVLVPGKIWNGKEWLPGRIGFAYRDGKPATGVLYMPIGSGGHAFAPRLEKLAEQLQGPHMPPGTKRIKIPDDGSMDIDPGDIPEGVTVIKI